ncbi:hypothetical protein [Pseudomonas fluorescens]|uniref:hypothetical protein n=1 Tax=Pseudomonas fluorescens TaxID=294 RepID=UPI00058A781F|nr:hypothetical protein [Pseudomonas fluorescens]CEL31221.1 hypothetical protein SRM1_04585 [Pseudomonas fluorescens]
MNNTIKGIFALTLLASATAQAAYVIYVPTEAKLGGHLTDGSIVFTNKSQEPTEPEVPQELFWDVEVTRKAKYYNSTMFYYKETLNNSGFNIVAGGFDHSVYNGVSIVKYKFTGGTNEQFGYEFETFTPPESVEAESGGITLKCNKTSSTYVPYYDGTSGFGMLRPASYNVSWTCDGIFPGLVSNRPPAMKMKFKVK